MEAEELTKQQADGPKKSETLSPDEVLEIARSRIRPKDIVSIIDLAIEEAQDPETVNPQVRQFLSSIIFPKDTAKSEDKRFKKVVFCTFEEKPMLDQLNNTIKELREEVKNLKALLRSKGEDV